MFRRPSSRKTKKRPEKLNLSSILDAVFIFIFFLLMTASFIRIFEISSDVPTTSENEPPSNNKKPLSLLVKIEENKIILMSGIPSQGIKTFERNADGKFQLEELHTLLIGIKKQNLKEDTIIFEPDVEVKYEDIVLIMDTVRHFKNTDESIYTKDKDGIDIKLDKLFSNIVFGNILS